MTPNTAEKALQKNVVEFLESLGWNYISPKEINNFKENKSDSLLKPVLKEQLNKINGFVYKGKRYKFDENTINKAVNDLDMPLIEDIRLVNQKISDMLTFGRAFEQFLDDGSKKSFSFKFIDFENIKNNLFHFTEEFKVKDKRIDIVLFVNGIPLGAVELKASNMETEEGISQMIRNQKEVPEFFKFAQILIAGNNHSPKYATLGTPKNFWGVWRENIKLSLNNRMPTELDKLIYSLCKRDRFLELIENFIVFDKGVKKIARYQQYFAIKEILKRLKKDKGGVVWHTQGSGKSLTMVMLTKLIKKKFLNSKIVVVTDRLELDKQIHDVFMNTDIVAKKANSSRHLIELLKSGISVITTLIHKFDGVKKENVIIKDKVFVLVDESHRTQGGELHIAMKKVFVNGIYIAFTGTPLLKKEKSTYAKFGGEIHRYTIDEAVRDKAVVPLLYEGRMVDQWINDQKGLDKRFERLTKDLSDDQIQDLKRKWARFQRLASSERRLEMVAFDITEHFKKFLKDTKFNAMLATSSKYDALKYKEIFDEDGELKTAVVISPPDMREGESDLDSENKDYIIKKYKELIRGYKNHNEYEDIIKDKFLKGEIELLIVVDKLLTGFDAPDAKVLYIDKELKEHNLLQAIARVNRLSEGKDYGLIVDYRGLLGELDKALTAYSALSGFDEADLNSAVFDIKEEIDKIKTFYSNLMDLFREAKFKSDLESYEVVLSDKKKRKQFYEYLSDFAKALNLALVSEKAYEILSDEEIKDYKEKLKFFIKLKEAVKIRYHEKIDFKKYESGMQKLLDTFISADEVIEIVSPVNIFDAKFDSQIKSLNTDNAKADAILNAISANIKENYKKNPYFYEKLSSKIEEILNNYKEKRLSEEEKLKEALKLKDELLTNKRVYPKELENEFQKVIYDNLKEDFENLGLNDDVLFDFIKKVDKLFDEISKKPDWKKTQRKRIEANLEDLLYEIEDGFDVSFNLDKITPKIVGVGIANY
ncbi:type I restriction endonuclease subunit R [Nautilia sp.]